jgi:hypothetical protein
MRAGGQFFEAEAFRERGDLARLVVGAIHQPGDVRAGPGKHERAELLGKLRGELAQIGPRLDEVIDDLKALAGLVVRDAGDEPAQRAWVRQAQHRTGTVEINLWAGKGHCLIEQTKRVTHASLGGAGEQIGRGWL